jgi:hypothetical protein
VTANGGRQVVMIAAPRTDSHARVVAHLLTTRFAADVVLWDTEQLDDDDGASLLPKTQRLVIAAGGRRIDSRSLRSVWWRRPGLIGPPAYGIQPETLRFCRREYASLIVGGLAAAGVTVINNPDAEARANRKPWQLATAQSVGLRVPDTIVSNDPTEVIAFWESHDRDCVYKPLSPPPNTFRETRLLTEADLPELNRLFLAPIIVQQRLRGLDLRVTIIEGQPFAAVARTDLPEAATDWRVDLALKWERYELDTSVSAQLRTLISTLGLHYGCADLRLDDEGPPYFLEVNPSGQFLFIEIDTGQLLCEAMCHLLMQTHAGVVS